MPTSNRAQITLVKFIYSVLKFHLSEMTEGEKSSDLFTKSSDLKDWVLSALLSKGISLREKGNLELHSRLIKLNLKCIYGYNLHRSLGALTPCSWSQHKSDFNFNCCSSSVDSVSKIIQDWHYWFTGKFNKNGEA